MPSSVEDPLSSDKPLDEITDDDIRTGAHLRQLVDRHGFDVTRLAEILGYQPSSFQQYLKPSVKLPRAIAAQVLVRMRAELEEIPEALRAFNLSTFCRARLNVYSATLSPVPIRNLNIQPRLFATAALADDPSGRPPVAWDEWREALWSRYRNYDSSDFGGDYLTCIMAPPGGGKTTLLQSLLTEAPENDFRAVYLPLRVYNSPREIRSVFDAVALAYEMVGWQPVVDFGKFIEREGRRGHLIILADGFDEVALDKRSRVVLQHLSAAKVPVVLTTRYVAPRLDDLDDLPCYHLAGLSGDDIVNHLDFVIGYIQSTKPGTELVALEDVRNLIKGFLSGDDSKAVDPPSAKSVRPSFNVESTISEVYSRNFLAEKRNPVSRDRRSPGILLSLVATQDIPDYGIFRERQTDDLLKIDQRKRREIYQLLSTPIFLNIFIGAILDRTNVHWTITSLLNRYMEFLFSKWRNSRTATVFRDLKSERAPDERDLRQILSLIGFLACVFEQCVPWPLTRRDIATQISALGGGSSDDAAVDEFLGDILQEASDAEIIQVGESESSSPLNKDFCRFKAPEELLAQIFAADFMTTATKISGFLSSYKKRAGSRESVLLRYANLSEFARNPNLRFLEDAAVSALINMSEDKDILKFVAKEWIADIRENLPIDLKYAQQAGIYNKEDAEKLLPLNLIVLGRAFTNSVLRQDHVLESSEVEQKITEIYAETNIEFVYQALSPFWDREVFKRRLLSSEVLPAETSFDLRWRRSETCGDLIEILDDLKIAQNSSERKIQFSKQRIERRIAYRMRYHHNSFKQDAFDRLLQFVSSANSELRPSHTLLVLGTMRMIYANLRGMPNLSRAQEGLLRRIRSWVDKVKEESKADNEAFDKLTRTMSTSDTSADRIVDTFIPENQTQLKVPFYIWKNHPGQMGYQILPQTIEEKAKLVGRLKVELEALQTAREHRGLSGTQQYEIEREAGCVFLMALTIDRYESQQLFVPAEYALRDMGLGMNSNLAELKIPYDRDDLLVKLFSGAKLGLDVGVQAGSGNDPNSTKSSVGGWQLYDYYAQTLWKVLRYVPSTAHYEYLR